MKTPLIAALTLAGISTAFAQSSVTVFGHMDVNLAYSKVGDKSTKAMDQGGYRIPSRLGFRGIEDLGDGYAAEFWLEAAVFPDTGTAQAAFWGRRSTVSISNARYGELRLGRDYVPTFWNVSNFAAFGTVGVGGSSNLLEGWPLGLGSAITQVRASNSVGYFLPRNLGGVYGNFMVAAPEGRDGARYVGGRLGYESGPLNVAAAVGTTPVGRSDYKAATVGGSYDFRTLVVYVNLAEYKLADDKQRHGMVGVSIPVGLGVIRASFAQLLRSGPGVDADDARHFAIGYSYSLSKRTVLYSAYGRINNEGNAAYVTGDTSPDGVPGKTASGLQFGVSHSF